MVKNRRIKILKNLKIFNFWKKSHLAGLSMNIITRSISKGNYVYKKGTTKSHYIFILVSGEIEVIAHIDHPGESLKDNPAYQEKNGQKTDLFAYNKKGKKVVLMKMRRGNYFGDEDGYRSKK